MEAEDQPAAAAATEEAKERRERRKKKSRWGKETEVGEKVLAGADIEELAPAVAEAQPPEAAEQEPGEHQEAVQQAAEPDGEGPARKKRRSRWEPESGNKQAATLPGLQITLPPTIAALVDIHVDPVVMDLQRQLNNVSVTCCQQHRQRLQLRQLPVRYLRRSQTAQVAACMETNPLAARSMQQVASKIH